MRRGLDSMTGGAHRSALLCTPLVALALVSCTPSQPEPLTPSGDTMSSLVATNGAEDTGSVTCKITVDDDVVVEQTSTGAYASVACSASGVDGVSENK